MNALLHESRSRLIEPGLPYLRQLRLSPTVAAVLEAEKLDTETWGDFAVLGMIVLANMRRASRGDLRGVIRLHVGIVGAPPDGPASDPTSVGSPDERRKPLARAAR